MVTLTWWEWALVVGPYALPVVFLFVGWLVGRVGERRHFVELAQREVAIAHLPALTNRRVPSGWQVRQVNFVMGSTVISLDYFKRFSAGLKRLVGGNLRGFEPLLERGRRESMLRLREAAAATGCDAVIGMRFETCRLASMSGSDGTAGIEIFAFGTGVVLAGEAPELQRPVLPPPA